MSERGVFAVDRGIWDHPMFASRAAFSKLEAWLWLISEAAWKPHRRRIAGVMVELARGQVSHSLRHLAECWGWSVKRVRGFLSALEEDAMIATSSGTGITVITICKYNEYQRVSRPMGTATDTQEDTSPPTLSHTPGAHEGHNKENREDKETSPSLRSGDSAPAKRPARTRAQTQLPDHWQVDEQDFEYASSRGFPAPKIREMANAFSNHHRSKGSLMADWHAAWRTWCDNEIKFYGGKNGHGAHHPATNESRSTAILTGVATAAERRFGGGGQGAVPTAPATPGTDDLELFGAGGSPPAH